MLKTVKFIFTFIIGLMLIQEASHGQSYADKQYYLIDSLDLTELSGNDLQLIDSCLKLYHLTEHDTNKIQALDEICTNMMHNDWIKYQLLQYQLIEKALEEAGPTDNLHSLKKALAEALNNIGLINDDKGNLPEALEYYSRSLKIQEEIGDKKSIAATLNNIGMTYMVLGATTKALEYFHGSLKMEEELKNKEGIAVSLNNLGFIYKDQGDIPKALEYFHRSLKIHEEISDKNGMAYCLNNLGIVYRKQGDMPATLEYLNHGLKLYKEIGNKRGTAISLDNIGGVHRAQGDLANALEHFLRSLELEEEIGNKEGVATSLNNIGNIYDEQNDIPKALEYYKRSLKIEEEVGNAIGITVSLNNIGGLQLDEIGNLTEAKEHLTRALKLGKETGTPGNISTSSKYLSKLAKKQGNYQEALTMYELHIQMRDSINNEKTQKATIRQQTKYEYEKAALVKEQAEKEEARVLAEETSRRDNLQYSVILIAILVLFGGVLALGFVKVGPRMAEGIIFFSFLILFEFILVLADPYIENWSGGAPGIKLLFNAGIAALIFPAHAFFESKLKGRLVQK